MIGKDFEIGFTGTRRGCTPPQRERLYAELCARSNGGVMVNGCCTGSDRIAWDMWRRLGGRFRFRPGDKTQWEWAKQVCRPQDQLFVPIGYMPRNEVIAHASILIATSGEMSEVIRSGTWATIRRARLYRTPRVICWPDGTVTREE